MAAAAMTHVLPSIIRHDINQAQDRRPVTASEISKNDVEQHSAEKNDVIHWSQGDGALRPEEVAKDPSTKCVGHSARHLGCDDFEFIKTLGTGTVSLYLSMGFFS